MIRLPNALALFALLVPGCAAPLAQDAPSATAAAPEWRLESIERGHAITMRTCAGCHAVGRTDVSPMPDAPAFRDVVRQRSLDEVETAFAEGLVTAHPAMPRFAFRAGEIDDLMAYLDSLRAEP